MRPLMGLACSWSLTLAIKFDLRLPAAVHMTEQQSDPLACTSPAEATCM